MKKLTSGVIAVMMAYGSMVSGAEVVRQVPDKTGGRMVGGWAGVLLGGAIGGPAGAIAGGLVSSWAGGHVQQAVGLSGDAYEVTTAGGDTRVVRSPTQSWQPGDQVDIRGNRLVSTQPQQARR